MDKLTQELNEEDEVFVDDRIIFIVNAQFGFSWEPVGYNDSYSFAGRIEEVLGRVMMFTREYEDGWMSAEREGEHVLEQTMVEVEPVKIDWLDLTVISSAGRRRVFGGDQQFYVDGRGSFIVEVKARSLADAINIVAEAVETEARGNCSNCQAWLI